MSTDFGHRLKELRERAGLSQTELGERIEGLSPGNSAKTAIARYEQGRLQPSMGRLQELADALGVEAAELLRSPGSRPVRRPARKTARKKAGRPRKKKSR